MRSLPHESKVVVIGGGIAGCSATPFKDNGWDTVLIERDQLTSNLACSWNGYPIRNNSTNNEN